MRIADTHAHHYFKQFDADRDEVFAKDLETGVEFVLEIGCDYASSFAALDLSQKYQHVFAAPGLHPCEVMAVAGDAASKQRLGEYSCLRENSQIKLPQSLLEFGDFLKELISQQGQHIKALGETGLDRFHDASEETYQHQLESFRLHLDLCAAYKLPVVVHLRNSVSEMKAFLAEEWHKWRGQVEGVIHCFSEDAEFARICLDAGFYLGFGGIATYPKAENVREALAFAPIERIITETDTPFLPVHSQRKQKVQRSESRHIVEVIELAAGLHNQDVENMSWQLAENAKNLFLPEERGF